MPPPPAERQLLGPVLGALVGLYLLTATIGRGGTEIRAYLHLPELEILWLSIAYLVAAALTAPVGTILGRRHPNAVAAIAAGLLLAGSALDAFAPNDALLMAGRIVSGLGAGALVADAVLLALSPGPQRTSTIRLTAGLGALAVVLGPVFGGLLTTMLGWRFAFLIALPPLLLALLVSTLSGITVAGRRTNH